MSSSCISDSKYLDSPEFLSLSLHITTAIASPIHILGIYCILFETPDQMKSVKWYLLNLHLWIVLFDYSITFLTGPYLFFPYLAGYPLGVLRNSGLSLIPQTLFVLTTMIYVFASIVAIFEKRFYTICVYSTKNQWKFWRKPWFIAHYILIFSGATGCVFWIPEQEQAKRIMFKNLPCLPDYLYHAPIFVLADSYMYFFMVFITSVLGTASEMILFCILLVRNSLKQLQSKSISQKTFEMQRAFSNALWIQMCIPIVIYLPPYFYILYSCYFNYYNQFLNSCVIIISSIHGLSSTMAMLIVHRPYRNFMTSFFIKAENQSEEISQKQNRKVVQVKNCIGIN